MGRDLLTMVPVAAVVLLVTGWGSAVAASVTSVLVTNTASHPVPVRQLGTANVNLTNTTAIPVHEANADANGNIKVHEQGTAKVAESGTWNVGITGTPAVKSGDTTTVLGEGGNVDVSPGQQFVLNPNNTDVSAYREVTVYLSFVGGEFNSNTDLVALTDDGSPYLFSFDDFVPPKSNS